MLLMIMETGRVLTRQHMLRHVRIAVFFFSENHDLHYAYNGDGTHSVVCDTCGYKEPAGNHKWGAWISSGTHETRTCTTCGASESRTVTNSTTPTTPSNPTRELIQKCNSKQIYCDSDEERDNS
jgi:hypothetical protein